MSGAVNKQTDDAIRELARRVYERDEHDPADRVPPADFATEFLLKLRADGWRHTNFGQPRTTATTRLPGPDTYAKGYALAREHLANSRKDTPDE
ncbi:hypothetical protein ACQP1V_43190 (plasmid) [Microtetraspora malaysiensis]|uniref:hypothetical protein n=1 Tax=Microtetraspora malaysiensis TaxID=161358 RepID=UPI003D90625F